MKTRIFYTKFWTDPYILSLNPTERLLFNYLITNENIGLTGIYEVADSLIQLSTGLSNPQIQQAKNKFMTDKKIVFHKTWVFIKNLEKYQSYTGEKNEIARTNELKLIPEDTLSILYGYTIDSVFPVGDSPINHKSEIKDHKLEIINYKKIEDVKEEDIAQIAETYNVPVSFVESKIDDIKNYTASTGKVYKDYLATLRNWVKKDAIQIKKEVYGKSVVGKV